jgi:hypothetical protein
MLEKDGHTFTVQCDFCPDTHDTDEDEFLAAVEAVKREGWKVFKQNGEWFHKCGCCPAG